MRLFLVELLLVELLEVRSSRRRRRQLEHERACAQAWADAAKDALQR